jgi:hypothetical protein
MDKQMFYLRQAVRSTTRLSTLSASVSEREAIAHYYVLAEDGTSAGGAAGSFLVAHGLECVDYICLPQPIARSQIADHETEHFQAYECAERQGFAVVLSLVLTWET